MSWNKFKFGSIKEFQEVSTLAMRNGLETMEEFENFLEANYSHLKK